MKNGTVLSIFKLPCLKSTYVSVQIAGTYFTQLGLLLTIYLPVPFNIHFLCPDRQRVKQTLQFNSTHSLWI